MTQLQRRLFIFFDEWLGILLLAYLDRTDSKCFWPVLIFWILMIYVVSYPSYWFKPWLDLVDKDEDDE